MTKDEAVKELLRLLPHLMGEDGVIVPRETLDAIKIDFGNLVARVGVAESNANSVTYAVDELRDNLRSLENYAEELQDLGDLETDIRSVQSQLEDL